MVVSALQSFNQAIIQMAVLLYQVDNKVTLTEQDALEELIDGMSWESSICVEAFKTQAISTARRALDEGQGEALLRSLQTALLYDAARAMEVAYEMTGVDGERSEDETECLALLTHKILARALSANLREDIATQPH